MTQPIGSSSLAPSLHLSSVCAVDSDDVPAISAQVASLQISSAVNFGRLEHQNDQIVQRLPFLFAPEVLQRECLANPEVTKELAAYIPVQAFHDPFSRKEAI